MVFREPSSTVCSVCEGSPIPQRPDEHEPYVCEACRRTRALTQNRRKRWAVGVLLALAPVAILGAYEAKLVPNAVAIPVWVGAVIGVLITWLMIKPAPAE